MFFPQQVFIKGNFAGNLRYAIVGASESPIPSLNLGIVRLSSLAHNEFKSILARELSRCNSRENGRELVFHRPIETTNVNSK